MQTCYRHPSVETGVSCSSCGNPICTECMTPTPVGMRCPDCAKQRTKVQTPRSMAGGDPQATYVLIALNIAAFAVQVIAAGSADTFRSSFARDFSLLGYAVEAGDWWQLVTSGFLHDGPIHLLFNMVGVFFLGSLLEPRLGTARFLGVYFASLLAGSLGALLLTDPGRYTLGASGAVFGLLGAAFIIMRRQGIDPMQTFIGPILILNIIITFAYAGTISVGGHLGGLAGGAIAALAVVAAEDRRSPKLGVVACVAIGVLAAVAGVAVSGS